jgi:hypothetical protein
MTNECTAVRFACVRRPAAVELDLEKGAQSPYYCMGRGSIISVLLYGKREHNLRITVWEEGA